MSAGSPVAGDCPGIFDVLINGQGYVFLRTVDTSLPFRTQKARYTRTPTFLERTNVSGAYSDNQQDFFLTVNQNDWSLGAQQRFFRSTDPASVAQFWRCQNIDVSTPGQVALTPAVASLTFAAAAISAAPNYIENVNYLYVATATNLYRVNSDKTITSIGAHGLGAAPSSDGMTSDGSNVYLSTTAAGTVGVRRWDGASFTTFSATGADSLAYLNNALYGCQNSNSRLVTYSTAGVASTLFTWQTAPAGNLTNLFLRTRGVGGKLYILFNGSRSAELWTYDGTAETKLSDFPSNLRAWDIEVAHGVVYVSGVEARADGGQRGVIFYFDGTTEGVLWKADTFVASALYPALAVIGDQLIFNDDTTGQLLAWNLARGGASGIGTYTVNGTNPIIASAGTYLVMVRQTTTGTFYPDSTISTSGFVQTSLFDFDNSLTKQFRSIKVDFDLGSGGNGGTVDISYQTDSVDGSWTSLQTSAVSGTEYLIPKDTVGRSLAVKVTLNKGTSTTGPVLKRIYVRAAPTLQAYRMGEYILDLSGRNGKSPVMLNNSQPHPLDGLAQATNLNAAIVATPFTIVDRFGSFTGIVEPGQTELIEVRPEEYIARVVVREV